MNTYVSAALLRAWRTLPEGEKVREIVTKAEGRVMKRVPHYCVRWADGTESVQPRETLDRLS